MSLSLYQTFFFFDLLHKSTKTPNPLHVQTFFFVIMRCLQKALQACKELIGYSDVSSVYISGLGQGVHCSRSVYFKINLSNEDQVGIYYVGCSSST